ncbi:hypothetical protein [Bartonella sp. AP58NXGY]|uniref:hypothetical protein n=1 Tax=Bartonella sp. AP58NXGY TaxID=3243498 RepID=UPI0035CF5900
MLLVVLGNGCMMYGVLIQGKKEKTSVGRAKHHGLVGMLDLMLRENAWGRFLKGEYFYARRFVKSMLDL